ncbi:MAG: diacylglycerol/lipid kinase family protein [Solirubrobacterales bacterium]
MNDLAEPPLLLIVNPSAGGGRVRRVLDRATTLLDRVRKPFRVEFSTSGEHAAELSSLGLDLGEIPVAVGGDGQVARVAGPLVGTDRVMGVLPTGRGNDLARGLGIPTRPDDAVQTLLEGTPRRIDVGHSDGRRFLGIASVGFDSRANEIANRTTWLPGTAVYGWAALRALVGWRAVRFTLSVDGQSDRIQAHTVAAANNAFYGGGMKMAPGASVSDGLLDLVIVGDVSRLRFLANFPKVFLGRHVDGAEVTCRRVREVRIEAGAPLTVFADGDPLTELPATIRILPNALSILCPLGDADA